VSLDEQKEEQKLIVRDSVFPPCRAIGIRGIYNMGVSCFMSCILQSLIHNPFIRNYFLGENHVKSECNKPDDCISCSLDEMFTDLYSKDDSHGYPAYPTLLACWQKTTEGVRLQVFPFSLL
jgi:ubiquitin carboxyl-terminal hydrolase 22/27/51